MAALRGERFHVDLPSDDEANGRDHTQNRQSVPACLPSFVKDIQERQTKAPRPPKASSDSRSANGFPTHKKRSGLSKFKQARADTLTSPDSHQTTPPSQPSVAHPLNGVESFEARQRREIDEENNLKLAQMSDSEIEQERTELMEGLGSTLIERLLRRPQIRDDSQPQELPGIVSPDSRIESQPVAAQAPVRKGTDKRVAFDVPDENNGMPEMLDGRDVDTPKGPEQPSPPSSLTDALPSGERPSVHFPHPPPAPDLDPNSDTFLKDLHQKYFSDLSSDPSKLAWMSDPSTSEQQYSPSNSDIPVSGLRFSFTGALIPPALSTRISTTKGLHHHGESPSSAGYTIGELAHLARSTFPTQRCMAFQTLGRVLYRLGKGEYAQGEEGGVIERGLWACVREGRALGTLQNEAARNGGHVSAKAYAVDALWLWRMGGGKEPVEVGAN